KVPSQGVSRRAPGRARAHHARGMCGLRGGTARVQRGVRPRASARDLPAEGRAHHAREFAQGRVLPIASTRLPGARTPLLAWPPVVGELFRRVSGWSTTRRASALHRAATSALRAEWRFTTGLKAGALRHILGRALNVEVADLQRESPG